MIIGRICNGINGNYYHVFRECCSSSNKCDINQGDCDTDNDCRGNLVCGSNNCPSPFPRSADCCEKGNITLQVKALEISHGH